MPHAFDSTDDTPTAETEEAVTTEEASTEQVSDQKIGNQRTITRYKLLEHLLGLVASKIFYRYPEISYVSSEAGDATIHNPIGYLRSSDLPLRDRIIQGVTDDIFSSLLQEISAQRDHDPFVKRHIRCCNEALLQYKEYKEKRKRQHRKKSGAAVIFSSSSMSPEESQRACQNNRIERKLQKARSKKADAEAAITHGA
ncbi:MAG: hypothetical protein WCG83_03885 [Candidatus Peregrinibacteria bacterium]